MNLNAVKQSDFSRPGLQSQLNLYTSVVALSVVVAIAIPAIAKMQRLSEYQELSSQLMDTRSDTAMTVIAGAASSVLVMKQADAAGAFTEGLNFLAGAQEPILTANEKDSLLEASAIVADAIPDGEVSDQIAALVSEVDSTLAENEETVTSWLTITACELAELAGWTPMPAAPSQLAEEKVTSEVLDELRADLATARNELAAEKQRLAEREEASDLITSAISDTLPTLKLAAEAASMQADTVAKKWSKAADAAAHATIAASNAAGLATATAFVITEEGVIAPASEDAGADAPKGVKLVELNPVAFAELLHSKLQEYLTAANAAKSWHDAVVVAKAEAAAAGSVGFTSPLNGECGPPPLLGPLSM